MCILLYQSLKVIDGLQIESVFRSNTHKQEGRVLTWEIAIKGLEDEHQAALRWFAKNAGQVVKWSEIQEQADQGTRLATQAKGIYKPAYTRYALSVRQTLNSPYADREVIYRPDGSWLYPYFQENSKPAERDSEYTNVGLMHAKSDRIPIGVLIQTKGKPSVEYQVLGLAIVTGWEKGYFIFESLSSMGELPSQDEGLDAATARVKADVDTGLEILTETFNPAVTQDQRKKIIAQVIERKGQPKFRMNLLNAYGRRCAVSGCDAVEALEAAHITPYMGEGTNTPQNGLLLRADIHTLFDLGLLGVDPLTMKVVLAPSLKETTYGELGGVTLRKTSSSNTSPSTYALAQHLEWSNLTDSD